MPSYFDLKMGFTCNNYCAHCVIEAKKHTPDYTTAQVKAIIDSVPKGDTIGLTGGEATIRADFLEIAEYAKATGHTTALQTNGTRLGDFEFAKEAVKYIDDVLIALHSSEEAIHDKIVVGEGMYKRTLAGLRNLVELNATFSTQTVISKINMHTLADTYDMIQAIAPGTWMSMTYPHPNGGAWKNRHKVCPSFMELKPHMHKALAKWAPLLRTEAIPLCYIFPYHEELGFNFDSQILSTGEESHGGIDPANAQCDLFDEYGRIEDYRLADLSEKRKGPRCKDCVFNTQCVGVWKEYVSMFHDKFDLFPISEKDAKSFRSTMPKMIPGTVAIPTGQSKPIEMDPTRDGALIISSNIKCPNTCVFCEGNAVPWTTKQIVLEAYRHAQYFIDNGYGQIEISGGDPIDMDETPKIIRYLKDHGVKQIILSTHGRRFAIPEVAEEYARAGLDETRIPLYGSTAAIHNAVADTLHPDSSASFDEAVLGIQNAHNCGIRVRAQTIITQQNKDDLENIFLTYLVATEDTIPFYTIGPAFLAEKTPEFAGNWFLPIKDVGPYLDKLLHSEFFGTDSHRDLRIMDIPYCAVGRYVPNFSNEPQYPDLGDQTCEGGHGSEENQSIPQYRIKSQFSECTHCAAKSICGGMARNELEMFGFGDLRALSTIDEE